MPTQLYRVMRLPSAGQCAGGAKAYRMRPEKAQLCRGLTFALSGAPPQEQAKDAPLFGASALERGVRRHSGCVAGKTLFALEPRSRPGAARDLPPQETRTFGKVRTPRAEFRCHAQLAPYHSRRLRPE